MPIVPGQYYFPIVVDRTHFESGLKRPCYGESRAKWTRTNQYFEAIPICWSFAKKQWKFTPNQQSMTTVWRCIQWPSISCHNWQDSWVDSIHFGVHFRVLDVSNSAHIRTCTRTMQDSRTLFCTVSGTVLSMRVHSTVVEMDLNRVARAGLHSRVYRLPIHMAWSSFNFIPMEVRKWIVNRCAYWINALLMRHRTVLADHYCKLISLACPKKNGTGRVHTNSVRQTN